MYLHYYSLEGSTVLKINTTIIYSIPENGSKPVDVLSLEGSTVLKINTTIVYSIPENAYKPQMSSHKVGTFKGVARTSLESDQLNMLFLMGFRYNHEMHFFC